MARAGRVVELVQLRRCETAIDDAHAGRVDRDAEGDRVVGLFGTHRLGRHHHQFVHQGGAGDVQLGAAHHDAVVAAFDDPHIQIGVALLVGLLRAITLGVGDDLGGAQIVVAGIQIQALDVVCKARVDGRQAILDLQQRHIHAGDTADDAHVAAEFEAHFELLGGARHLVHAMGRGAVLGAVGDDGGEVRVVVSVVPTGHRNRHLKTRMVDDVGDLLATPVDDTAVVQGCAVLRGGHETHAVLPDGIRA